MAGMEARLPAGGVEADRGGWDRDRPEQAGTRDPRLEVVMLMRRVTDRARVEQIDSYEAERAFAQTPVKSDVGAGEEAHVRVEIPLAPVAPARPAANF